MNIGSIAHGVGKWVSKNLPTLATGVGIGGFITTVILTAKAAPQAKQKLDELKMEKEKPTVIDKVKVLAPTCWPVAVCGTASLACFIFADRVNLKRNAAAIAAYQISEAALKSLQNAAVETVGKRKAEEIQNRADTESIRKNPPNAQNVIVTGNGDFWVRDSLSGRDFLSSKNSIERAVNVINAKLIDEGSAPLNDFYYELGLPMIGIGDELGWNMRDLGDKLEVRYSYDGLEDGTPCLVINYNAPPMHFYDRDF